MDGATDRLQNEREEMYSAVGLRMGLKVASMLDRYSDVARVLDRCRSQRNASCDRWVRWGLLLMLCLCYGDSDGLGRSKRQLVRILGLCSDAVNVIDSYQRRNASCEQWVR